MKQDSKPEMWRHWRGLGAWNYYYFLKFALLWLGYLNFHALNNLVFAAFLLFPIGSSRWHRRRHIIAIPIGIMLFYHDTWLPSVQSILAKGSQVEDFSAVYALELINRFVNWQWIGAAFVLLVAYLFLAQWLRITVFTLAILISLNIKLIGGPLFHLPTTTVAAMAPAEAAADRSPPQPENAEPPTNANINAYLNQFYQHESQRMTDFPQTLPADAQPFDLLVIQICSLSWSDLAAVKLRNHPLWGQFDVIFDNFNSATAYSGPASIRLARASCGQQKHKDLYSPANRQCYLFDNLARLGFTSQLMLDHSGEFGNFLQNLREDANFQAPLMSMAGIGHTLTSFDGAPIYDAPPLLDRWLAGLKSSGATRSATFFNIIPLHDGTRYTGARTSADYASRASTLFDQLDAFFKQLEASGRRVVVVVVPEHGAALAGDKMQMPGLRDIPSPAITHVPVGIKLIGIKAPHQQPTLRIASPTSYLALSELVSRLLDGKLFSAAQIDWPALTRDLPQTAVVSENDSSVVIDYHGKSYIRLDGGSWVPYPQ